MADAGINIGIRADSSQAAAGLRDLEDAIRRAGRTAQLSGQQQAELANRNLQLYREETRILDLRARGRNNIADALRAEVDMRRAGMRLELDLRVSEQEGLALARRRLAVEREIAEQTARRGGAAGGGPIPPGGAPPRPPGGNPPPGGRPPPGGNPPRGGGGGLRDAGIAYQIAQDGIQGGLSMGLAGIAIGTANQVPQLLTLIGKYKKTALGIGAATATFGAIEAYRYMMDQIDEGDATDVGRRRIQNSLVNKSKNWNRARAKLTPEGTKAGEEESVIHTRFTRDYDAEAGMRGAKSEIADSAADQAYRNRRAALADNKDQIERIRQIAALDKEYEAEKDRAAKQALSDELKLANAEASTAQRRKNEIATLMAAETNRIALGRMATDAEIKAVASAKAETAGLDSRYKAAQARLSDLEQRSKLLNLESRTLRPLQDAGIDAAAARETAAATEAMITQGNTAFKGLQKTIGGFIRDTVKTVQEETAKAKKAQAQTDTELRVMELRSRGRNAQADKLEKKTSVDGRVQDLIAKEGRTPEEAKRIAEREYDLRNPSRRIRGAGYGGREKEPGSALDRAIGGGIDGTGGLDALSKLNSRNRKVGDGATGSGFSGLDGLDEMQKKNRKIRGAGFQGAQSVVEAGAAVVGAAMGPGGSAALPAILSAISNIGKKLDGLTNASRTIRR